jgi:hypothetical protein
VFTLNREAASDDLEFSMPYVGARIPGENWNTWVRLAAEANGWGMETDGDRTDTILTAKQQTLLAGYDPLPSNGKRRWLFLLDNASPMSEWWSYNHNWVSASEYNGRFQLLVDDFKNGRFETRVIAVPATRDLWPQASEGLALSGRLSGNWVFEGASDQGVMLSVSGKMPSGSAEATHPDELPMLIFLAHYTFDTEGNMLWLTGAAEFEQGENQVAIPIENVSNGEFRGSRSADREVVGSVTITSNSCNNLSFEYDYSGVGLGVGQRRMKRLFSLETAGHDCRDHEAKVAANR